MQFNAEQEQGSVHHLKLLLVILKFDEAISGYRQVGTPLLFLLFFLGEIARKLVLPLLEDFVQLISFK